MRFPREEDPLWRGLTEQWRKNKTGAGRVYPGTISGDIKLGGTLRHPTFEALNEETLLQAAVSALLSSITGALAVLPFVQLGGEPDAPCVTLLADAKETSTRNNPAAKVTPKKG